MGRKSALTDTGLERGTLDRQAGDRIYDQNRSDGGYVTAASTIPATSAALPRGGRAITFFCLAAGPAAGSAATTKAQNISFLLCTLCHWFYMSYRMCFFSANCVYICPVVRFFTFQPV